MLANAVEQERGGMAAEVGAHHADLELAALGGIRERGGLAGCTHPVFDVAGGALGYPGPYFVTGGKLIRPNGVADKGRFSSSSFSVLTII